MVIEAIIHIY